MLFAELTQTWRAVAAASGRLQKVGLIADCLQRTPPREIEVVVGYLSGELRQRRTGIGWAALKDAPPPAREPSLHVAEVDDAFEQASVLSGKGSATGRRQLLHALLARATDDEQ